VVVLDDLSTGKESNVPLSNSRCKLIQGSITDLETVQAACCGMDYVFHMAARTSVPRSVKDPAETNRINADGTLNVLLAARDAGVKRVVYSGSSSVYGETPILPKREDMPPAPISPYGVSKLIGELYGQVFNRCYGLEFVTVRYFNVFGPRQDPGSAYSGVLSLFITCMQKGAAPTVYGDGEQSRDFTYIENGVQANLLACGTPGIAGMGFNAGTGNRYTLNDTLALLGKFAGRPVRAKYIEMRSGDIRDSQADISLARQKLGYEPRVDFEEGLRRTWDWYCSSASESQLEPAARFPTR